MLSTVTLHLNFSVISQHHMSYRTEKKEHTEINKQQQNKMLIDPQNFIMGS